MPLPARVGRYEVKSRIGGGGMGTLYLARDTNPTTDRLVALKLLNANLEHGDLRARFSREARSLAALSHPNIVVIHDSGEFQGAPFIVMEYVRGESLAEKIRRHAPMSLGQKVRLMAELCDGLAHAHGAGIVHRDIKPANLMVDQHGRLKILDFGIAREGDGPQAGAAPLTRLHTSIGTPGYMSPEQIEGVEVDHRTDLFSLGTVCYELLTYREAFAGATTRQIEKRVMHDDPPPLESLVPGLDPKVIDIIAFAMKKDPRERVQSAGELLDLFARVRAGLAPDEQPTHVTPLPSADASGGHESRRHRAAEMAFRRALAGKADGALDFARRSALEALAEDPGHEAARTLARELGGAVDAGPVIESTMLATNSESDATRSAVETVVSPSTPRPKRPAAPLPWRPEQRPWWRYAPVVGAVIVAVAVLGLAVVFRDRWLPPDPGPVVVTPQPSQSGPGPGPVKDEPVPTTLIARLEDRQGLPVDDADVSLNPGNVVAPGAGDGQYLFESVLPGTYTLTARHRAFKERTVNLDVAPGGVRQVLVLDAAASTSNVPLGTSNRSTAGVRPQLSGRESSSGGLSGGPTSVTGRTTPPDADRVTPPGPPAAPGPSGPMGVRSSVLAQDALDQAIKALTQDGDVDRAERLLTEAKRLDPESKDVAKEIERVREIRATERRQKVREFVLRAQRLFREAGDLDAALREVENALNLLPSDPQAVALREEILRVKAIGAKKPPPVDVFRSNEWNTNDATTWSRG